MLVSDHGLEVDLVEGQNFRMEWVPAVNSVGYSMPAGQLRRRGSIKVMVS
jgi:hypothetical protein